MQSPIIRRKKPLVESRFSNNFNPLLKDILLRRGIACEQEMQMDFSRLPDPFSMRDMHKAVERLWLALQQQQSIIIVGDYDADGATSTALAVQGLTALGFSKVSFEVPNRFEYGYGLSEAIVDEIAWQKPQLLITVDNGISSIAGVARANNYGIDVIVTDHHLPAECLPPACAIINPNQPHCHFPTKSLAGVGVVFYLLIALRLFLRERQWFIQSSIPEPNLADFLDLVALGTVADLVPMDFYNRILVKQGISRIRAGKARAGIRQLLMVAAKDYRYVSSVDLGFALAPRLNAVGRLDDMAQGIMLLLTDSDSLAYELSQTLDELNKDRREIEQAMQVEALEIVENITKKVQEIPRGFCLYSDNWHQGVVGLVASRIKEKYHRPVIAFASAGNGEVKGSGRSIKGIHLRDVLDTIASKHPQLIEKFGGHAMAAGLSLQEDNLPRFQQAYAEELASIADTQVFDSVLESDGEIAENQMNLYTAQMLRDELPWGQQFPEPMFDGVFYVRSLRAMGEKHIKLVLAYDPVSSATVEAVFFNTDAAFWQQLSPQKIAMVYRMAVNHYQGRQTLQLIIQHMVVSE